MKSLIVINEEVVKIENVYDNGFDGFYNETVFTDRQNIVLYRSN